MNIHTIYDWLVTNNEEYVIKIGGRNVAYYLYKVEANYLESNSAEIT